MKYKPYIYDSHSRELLDIMRLNKKHDGSRQYPIYCKIDEDNWCYLANEPNKTRTINKALEEYWLNHAHQFLI